MSQLIDKLNKTNKSATQSMGFRTSRSEEGKSPLVIIAKTSTDDSEAIKECTAGADAVYLQANGSGISADSIQKTVKALTGIPCGISVDDAGSKKIDGFIKAGCDFLILTMESPVGLIPQDEKTGTLLLINSSLEDSLVRIINNLPVDAVITTEVTDEGKPITWQNLLSIQRLATLITKPVIIPVSPNISSGELKAVRDADIDGILVTTDTSEPGRIERIRQDISKLPPRSVKEHRKSDVFLPRSAGPVESAAPEEDDDDDY